MSTASPGLLLLPKGLKLRLFGFSLLVDTLVEVNMISECVRNKCQAVVCVKRQRSENDTVKKKCNKTQCLEREIQRHSAMTNMQQRQSSDEEENILRSRLQGL